jgi:hypothetical protein
VAPITIVFSILLILLGGGFFAGTGWSHVTALIPTFLGLPLLLLGVLGYKDNLRMHVMHGAALLGLLGFLGGAIMGLPKVPVLLDGSAERPAAIVEQLLMALICAVFVGLCVRSFILARRARAQKAAS